MCLSGDVVGLSAQQWQCTLDAIGVYGRAAAVLKHGVSRRVGEHGPSWRHPTGWQAVVRTNADTGEALIVAHTFASAPAEVAVSLPPGDWSIAELFPAGGDVRLSGNAIRWATGGDFAGQVVRLSRA